MRSPIAQHPSLQLPLSGQPLRQSPQEIDGRGPADPTFSLGPLEPCDEVPEPKRAGLLEIGEIRSLEPRHPILVHRFGIPEDGADMGEIRPGQEEGPFGGGANPLFQKIEQTLDSRILIGLLPQAAGQKKNAVGNRSRRMPGEDMGQEHGLKLQRVLLFMEVLLRRQLRKGLQSLFHKLLVGGQGPKRRLIIFG